MNGSIYSKSKRMEREESKYKVSQRDSKKFDKLRYGKKVPNHFDTIEVCKIEDLVEINPVSALEKLEAYLENYPNDYYAHALYASYLIILRRFEEAYEAIQYTERALSIDSSLQKYEDKIGKNINSLDYAKIKYYLYTNNYQMAHDIAMWNHELFGSSISSKTILYIKNKLDTCDKMNYYEDCYSANQILNYSEDRMLEHIVKHLTEGNDDKEVPNSNMFVRNFPIEDVITEVKKHLVDENAVYLGLIEDNYYFRYDDCGKENNRFVDFFKVVCFHGTKNIITILPVTRYNELSYVDINYINPNSVGKCKRLVM